MSSSTSSTSSTSSPTSTSSFSTLEPTSSVKRQRTEQSKKEKFDDKISVQVNLVVVCEEPTCTFITSFTTTLFHLKKIDKLIEGLEERENYPTGILVNFFNPEHDFSSWKTLQDEYDDLHLVCKMHLEEMEDIVGKDSFERDFIQYKVSNFVEAKVGISPPPSFSVTRLVYDWL